MSSLADTIRREDEEARLKQAALEAVENDDETGGFNFRQLASWARARGDVAEAEKWEAREKAQDAPAPIPTPVQYTVTMTSEQYGVIYGAILTAQISFGARAANAKGLTAEFAAHDEATANAAMAVLDSLNFKAVA